MAGIQHYWEEYSPNTKRMIVGGSVVILVLGFLYMAASGKIEEKKARLRNIDAEEIKTDEDIFDANMLERDLYDRLQAELEEKSVELERAQKRMAKEADRFEVLNAKLERLLKDPGLGEKGNTPVELDMPGTSIDGLSVPPPPPPPSAEEIRGSSAYKGEYVFSTQNGPNSQQEEYDEIIGGIGHVISDVDVEEEPEIKKNIIKLPPSFMEATLLTGVDATIGGRATENPLPMLLHIAAPAVLPNKVKADLRGCFVFASGYGNLATERLNMRLVRLSCLSSDGRAVIEEKIEGYLVDTDGKIGLSANVYMHAGELMGRQALLAALESVAGTLKSETMTTSISALGATSTIKSGEVPKAAAADGVQAGLGVLTDLYKMLIKETLPTLEVGPKKKITVVIEKSVDLEINDISE